MSQETLEKVSQKSWSTLASLALKDGSVPCSLSYRSSSPIRGKLTCEDGQGGKIFRHPGLPANGLLVLKDHLGSRTVDHMVMIDYK